MQANPLAELLQAGNEKPTFSPVYDPEKSNHLILTGNIFKKLETNNWLAPSPRRITKKGMLQEFFEKSCLLKVKADVARGFDISEALYPSSLEMAAWGIVIDRIGRVYSAETENDQFVELIYQYGGCSGRKDWERLVSKHEPNEYASVYRYYSRLRTMASKRITLSGTVGFGLWDSLWMSFDLDTAREILNEHPDFGQEVLNYYNEFHLSAIRGMLSAGIRIIFLREHPGGFVRFDEFADVIDGYLGESYRQLTKEVSDADGMLILDCDTDEIAGTDYPKKWGFHGIGPMVFRDEEDLDSFRENLDSDLMLVGSITSFGDEFSGLLPGYEGRPQFIPGTKSITNLCDDE